MESVYLGARMCLSLNNIYMRESINNLLICKLLDTFFKRKQTSKNGTKRKSVLSGTDADILVHILTFLVILLYIMLQN